MEDKRESREFLEELLRVALGGIDGADDVLARMEALVEEQEALVQADQLAVAQAERFILQGWKAAAPAAFEMKYWPQIERAKQYGFEPFYSNAKMMVPHRVRCVRCGKIYAASSLKHIEAHWQAHQAEGAGE